MISAWPYIDRAVVTQRDPQGSGEQVRNLLSDSSGSQEADAVDENFFTEDSLGYHIRTQLADGRPALIIDPGSVGNLCGDRWAKTGLSPLDANSGAL